MGVRHHNNNLQGIFSSSAVLWIYMSSHFLLLSPVSAQDGFPFEFDRRCRNAVDCVFEAPGSSDRVYLDCDPEGYCACANYRLIADVPVWNLQWEPGYKQCTIAETGPCGKNTQLEISCSYGLDCIKARCRAPERIGNGNRGDWCYDDLECQEGLKCSLVSYQFQPIRRCMDRATTAATMSTSTSTSTSTSPPLTQTADISADSTTTTTAPRMTTILTQSSTPSPSESQTTVVSQTPFLSVNYDEELHIEEELAQNETASDPSTTIQIIDQMDSITQDIVPSDDSSSNGQSSTPTSTNQNQNEGVQSRNNNNNNSGSDGLPQDEDMNDHLSKTTSNSSNRTIPVSYFRNVFLPGLLSILFHIFFRLKKM